MSRQSTRSPPPAPGSHVYAALPRGAGAPRPAGDRRSSSNGYVDQRMSSPARGSTRNSDYSYQSAREDLAEPTLQPGFSHPYPMRQQTISPAPSYGSMGRETPPPGERWTDSTPTLNEWMETRGRPKSMATTLNSDPAASSITLEKLGYADFDDGTHATLLRKEGYRGAYPPSRRSKPQQGFWTRRKIWTAILLLVLAAAIAIGVGVYEATKNKSSSSSGAANNAANGQALPTNPLTAATTSAASSAAKPVVTQVQLYGAAGPVPLLNGTMWNYTTTLGGTWCAIPFNDSARPQTGSKALNEQWDWSADLLRGVNLGGWLVIEPFIVPTLFYPYENDTAPAVDEWTLMGKLGANAAQIIENHYATFITETDIAQIAAAGLNWVRLPVPYWMIETYAGEPFLEGVSFKYFQQAIAWCRKYGIRIELDLHTVPGSQNGLNHSGKLGTINFLNGIMGIANAQRTLNYIRTLAEFVSQPQYENVIQGFMVVNEPYLTTMGATELRSFYFQAYEMLRGIGGVGVGHGPMMFIHDGFVGQAEWVGFLQGADRLAIETHPYLAFSPDTYSQTIQQDVTIPCQWWATGYNQSMAQFGFSSGNEWSLAMNDCGEYVVGVNTPIQYTGDCSVYTDYPNFSPQMKTWLHDMTMAYQDAFRNQAFWTWKTGISPITGRAANPLWSYSLGLQQGWMPQDARGSIGACQALMQQYGLGAAPTYSWASPLAASATGGAGNNVILAQQQSYGAWPVTSLTGYPNLANFPTYTATAVPITLSATSFPASLYPAGVTVAGGNGWNNASDTAPYATPVAGCSYLNPWSGVGAAIPAAPCTGNAAAAPTRFARRSQPTPTPAPVLRRSV